MKGRTTCPECKHEFVLDVPDNKEQYDVVCPKCENQFIIKTSGKECGSDEECLWEEHGEPRKTILSSIKPKTNKPMIAAILLLVVFCLGVSTAAFSEQFIESSLDVASGIGLDGTVKLTVIDVSNSSIKDANITVNGIAAKFTYANESYSNENIEPGIQLIEVSASGYETKNFEIMVTPFFASENTITMEEGTGIGDIEEFDASFCSIILVIFSVFPIIGAVVCLKRQHFDVAMAGSLLGILSFGFFLIGSIISIVAFVILMKSRDEFENGKKGKTF